MRKSAEERVNERLRDALPADEYRLYRNVRWLGKADANTLARDGETDLLIVHRRDGLLVVETKGGRSTSGYSMVSPSRFATSGRLWRLGDAP